MTVTDRLTDVCFLRGNNAGAAELQRARLCLLDWLGVTIAGAQEPVVRILAMDAAADASDRGQRLIGRSEITGLRDAVLVNGAAGHALDYDDGMPVMMGHPSVAIIPALLALAVDHAIHADRLLRAIVSGAEAAGRIGLMIGSDHYARGFHCTGTVGALAGTMAAAYLLNLPKDQTAHALGLAGTRAAGLRASFGSDAKPLHAAWAAQIALTSVQWAAKGMTGAADIMGSQQGFAGPLSTNPDAARGLGEVETPFVHSITFKAHAACAVTHPAIDATVAILNEGRFSAANIAAIVVKIAPAADSICNIAAPQSGLELKFSVRAVVAMTLLGIDTANPSSYSDALAADANLLSLIARTEVHLVPDFELGMTGVKIELADGCVFERQVGFDFVSDSAELTEMLSNKFLSLAAQVTGESAAEKCLAMIMGPNSHFSARTLLELVGPASA
jgi:2-methylcitrate dehydratase PrpD